MTNQSNINKNAISQSKCQLNFAFSDPKSPKSLLRILNVWIDLKDLLKDPLIEKNPKDSTIRGTQSVLYFSSSKFLSKLTRDCVITEMPEALQNLLYKLEESQTLPIVLFPFGAWKLGVVKSAALTNIYMLSLQSYQYKQSALLKKDYNFTIYEDHSHAIKLAFLELIMNPSFLMETYTNPLKKGLIANRLISILEKYASYFSLSYNNHLLDQIEQNQKESFSLLDHMKILSIQLIGKNILNLIFMYFFSGIYKPNIEKIMLLTLMDFCNFYYKNTVSITNTDKEYYHDGIGYLSSLAIFFTYLYVKNKGPNDQQSMINKITTLIYGTVYSTIAYQFSQVILNYADTINFDDYFSISKEFDNQKVLKHIQDITRSDHIEKTIYMTVALNIKEPNDNYNYDNDNYTFLLLLLSIMPENTWCGPIDSVYQKYS